jgi:hypothetical protein
MPAIRSQETGHHSYRGSLTRSVWPDKTEYFTVGDSDGHIIHRLGSAEGFADAIDGDHSAFYLTPLPPRVQNCILTGNEARIKLKRAYRVKGKG